MFNQTLLHPLGLAAMLALGLATLAVPRRWVLVPMLIMACFVSPAQRIVVMTLDFNLLRLMLLFAWARLLVTGEARGFRWKLMDTLLVAWCISATGIMALREGSMSALVYRLGLTYDAIGMYFLFRILVRGWRDARAIIISAAVISVPVAAVFLVEQFTGRNMFAIFGGVPEITAIRDGRLRCRGPFAHPIYAGCFWAALMPLIGSLWWTGRRTRWLAPVGLVASAITVLTTSSATPITALILAIMLMALYPLRDYVSWMRWGAGLGLIGLHLVMINPVWHLLARINLVGGTGWYRFKLIDEFVHRFDEWWLAGTSSYPEWWANRFDAITNQFVLEATDGGLLTLLLFVAMIMMTFHGVGRISRMAGGDRFRQFAAWGLGAALLIHCADFLAVSYFGQVMIVWYLGLAMVASLQPGVTSRIYRVAVARRDDAETSKPRTVQTPRPGLPCLDA